MTRCFCFFLLAAMLLPCLLSAQQRRPRKIFEVTVKHTDGRKSRGIPVALTDSTILILRKKPISPVLYFFLGVPGTALGRYRGNPDTLVVPVQSIEKISAGRRSAKWIAVPLARLAMGVLGGMIGLEAGRNAPGYFGELGGVVVGAAVGISVGIPLGVGIANSTRKKYTINGSMDAYRIAKPDLARYLPEAR